MATDSEETERIVSAVLKTRLQDPTKVLQYILRDFRRRAPEFYDGVIQHGPRMKFTAQEWFEFFCKVPHWRLLREKSLMGKLSPKQRELLGVE